MSGDRVVGSPSAQRRWEEAEELLADVDRRNPPRRPGRRWSAGVSAVVCLVLVALAAAIAAIVLGGGSTVPAWREAAGLALSAGGFVVAAGAGVWMWRSGQRGGRPPLSVLDRAQRRLLRDQIRGRAPVDPTRLRLIRFRATQLSQQAPMLLMVAALALLEDGQTLGSDSRSQVILSSVLAAVFVVAAVGMTRQIDQANAFLGLHPEQQTYVPPAWSAPVLDGPDVPPDLR